MPTAREFFPPYPARENPAHPIDATCGHRHPPGLPCWGMDGGDEIGEPCIHAARCFWCGNSIQMDDAHHTRPGPPDSRIHQECLAEWIAAGEPSLGPRGRN